MIPSVTAALAQFGLLRPGEIPRFHIGLTKGDTLWLDAFIRGGRFFHIKISDVISLEDEARIYKVASGVFREFMPPDLGYCVRDGWEIFVTEGVAHSPLFADAVLGAKGDGRLVSTLCEFFQTSRRTSPVDQDSTHTALLLRLEAQFKDTGFSSLLAHWCSGAGQGELEAIGCVEQHGDFVQNNLGVAGSRMIVFDWEDYGKVRLPGLDLCTLLLLSLEPDAARAVVQDRTHIGDRFSAVLKPACRALDVDISDFVRLIPLYLLTFLHLKGNYAAEIRTRLAALLQPLAQELGPNRPLRAA